MKKFKVQAILVLEFMRINNCKILNSRALLIASDSDIAEAFKTHTSNHYVENKKFC